MANFNIDYLVVAGGGGGGGGTHYQTNNNVGGGGAGAGGLLTSTGVSLTIGASYTVLIGDGGAGGPWANNSNSIAGTSGSNSSLTGTGVNALAIAGGGGGSGRGTYSGGGLLGLPGGSGGGSGFGTTQGGTATTGQGNNGGFSTSNTVYGSGGGGGAGGAGVNGNNTPYPYGGGAGGAGIPNSITGISPNPYYAGGGGAGPLYEGAAGYYAAGGDGGSAIGGSGGRASTNSSYSGTAGAANTGSGGGGGCRSSISNTGGAGGSGIVILRYTTADIASYTATGITPTEDTTTISGQTILSFTTVGTGYITFTAPPPPTLGTRVTNPVTGFESPVDIGLKLPSGTNANQPSGTQGMIRNDTGETTGGSTSAIEHYNGTTWKYFAATESVDNPLFASQNFNTVLYDGNSGVKTINTVGFQPDLVWTKAIDFAGLQGLTNSINGDETFNIANTTAAINTNSSAPKLFNSLGFTLGAGNNNWNSSLYDYVSWNWKAGGLINESADFNGSSSYIQTSLSLNAASNSISFWFNADSVGSQNNVLYFNNRGGRIDISINGTGSNTPSSNFESIFINSTTAITGWNFVSIVFTGWASSYSAGNYGSPITANVYLNGGSAVSVSPTPYGWSDGLRIGRSGGGYYYDGLVGQVRVFDSALTSSEVTELYNETAADNSTLNYPQDAGCVAAYPLGENANDLSNTYNGTQSNVTFGKPGYLTRNNDGTVESTVSANVAAGFSIVKYNSGTSARTAGHGLSQAVEMVICKPLVSGPWAVWNKYMATDLDKNYMPLTTAAVTPNASSLWNYSNWGATKIGSNNPLMFGNSNDVICYCWHSVAGYSKISSYLGDGGTNNFISTGFEPAFVMIKRTDDLSNWRIFDNKRGTQKELYANSSAAEPPSVSYINFNDLGFTLTNSGGWINNLNGKFIYMAFATS